MKRTSLGLAVAVVGGAGVLVPASPASAADFCASKIGGSVYVQKNFSSGGSVAATVCAPAFNQAGNAYLYASGSYANVSKYMKLTIKTEDSGTVFVEGNFVEYAYRARPAGLHTYTVVMRNAAGATVINNQAFIDYE